MLRPLNNWYSQHILIVWFAINLLDAASTYAALWAGPGYVQEGNPIMGTLFATVGLGPGLLIKIAAAIIAGWAVTAKFSQHSLRIPIMVMALVAMNNSMHALAALAQ